MFFIGKRLSVKSITFYFSVVASFVFFTMLSDCFTSKQLLNYGEKQIQRSLRGEASKAGILTMDITVTGGERDLVGELLMKMKAAEEIEGIGNSCQEWLNWKEMSESEDPDGIIQSIIEIQRSHENDMGTELMELMERPVHAVIIPQEYFYVNKMPLEAGAPPEEYDCNAVKIYLGSNFRKIPVGSTFHTENPEYTEQYVIAGRLEPKALMLGEYTSQGDVRKGNMYQKAIALDNMVVLCYPEKELFTYSQVFVFTASNECEFEDACAALKKIVKQYGISAKTERLSDFLKKQDSVEDYRFVYFGKMLSVLAVGSFLLLITTQMFVLLKRKEEIAVWLISGIEKSRIYRILLAENLFKNMIAFALSIVTEYLYWKRFLGVSFFKTIYGTVFWKKDILIGGVAIAFAVAAAGIPFIYFVKKSRAELIRGNWNEAVFKNKMGLRGSVILNILFMASLVVSFLTLYFSIDFLRKKNEVLKEQEKCRYTTERLQNCMIKSDNIDPIDRLRQKKFTNGNVYYSVFTCYNNQTIDKVNVDILMVQNEELKETIQYVEDFEKISGPRCIVGAALKEELSEEGGIPKLLLGDIEFSVIGFLKPITFEKKDDRVIAYGESLNEAELKQMTSGFGSLGNVAYKSSRREADEDLRMFEELVTEAFDGEEDTFIHYTEAYYQEEIVSYLTIVYMLLLSSLFCCIFLSAILTETKGYEMYLKRVLGFSKIRMVVDVGRQLIIPELYALGLTGVFTLIAESVQGNVTVWFKNVFEGFVPVSFVFILLGTVMSMIPCMMLKKKPAEALKYSE